jgi:alpha-D-xyloside xylohydrolase
VIYDDDGVTYDYEKGRGRTVHLHWDDSHGTLDGKGLPQSLSSLTKVVR